MKLYFSALQAKQKSSKSSQKDRTLRKIFKNIEEACEDGKYCTVVDSKTIKQEFTEEIKDILVNELGYEAYIDFPGLCISWKEKNK